MDYKCKINDSYSCLACKNKGNEEICKKCVKVVSDNGSCPIVSHYIFPKGVKACNKCLFEPEEREVTKVNELEIKKSEENDTYQSGAIRDKKTVAKGRFDLLPWDAIWELAIHCAKGAEVYGERNCEKGVPQHSLIDSATRHLACYQLGMDDENHLAAAMWNIAFAIYNEKNNPEMQDIPVRQGKVCLYRKGNE